MSSKHTFVFTTEESSLGVRGRLNLNANDRHKNAIALINMIKGGMGGTLGNHTVASYLGGTAATATVTFTGLPVATQTIVICGVTFTAVVSGATGNQFNIGADATITATNLTTAVNASASLSDITASSAAGVVTLTCKIPGTVGNMFGTVTETLTNATATGFSGGANDSTVTFTY